MYEQSLVALLPSLQQRPDIFNYTKQQQAHEAALYSPGGFFPGSELMVKERIPPEMITGLIVSDLETRNSLLESLRVGGLIMRDEAGAETIFNRPIDKFIHVSSSLKEEMITS